MTGQQLLSAAPARKGWATYIGATLRLLAVVAVLAASMAMLNQLRATVEELASPQVQQAQQRAQIAEADNRAAQLRRDTANQQARQAVEPSWQQRIVSAEGAVIIALLVALPIAALAILVAAALLLRRHLSLATKDGRVPLVGLDRELSREALLNFQQLQGGYQVLSPPPRRLAGELDSPEPERPRLTAHREEE
ncbi:hypothetical protein [Candidatus Nephthysia bennettiae]|uniref:Uncharacterized protein n=1 Tax=Candidatus Nephthysia bennettiae TaxID=3127016 RepID=A0A934N6N3_9BACT|nr:hypothetical protein [Candidatus Dormibacteraeota bacterium]